MLAYSVEWHMREAWRELMLADEDQSAKKSRDPVAPAIRSDAALHKINRRRLEDDSPVHSFATLLNELATIVRNTCRTPNAGKDPPAFQVTTIPTSNQKFALELIDKISM